MNDENQNPNENAYANPPERNYTLHYQGFLYTWKKQNITSILYWCKFTRSKNCKAKLNINNQGVAVLNNEHSESCKLRNRIVTENLTHDVRERMVCMTEEISLNNIALTPKQIWLRIRYPTSQDVTLILYFVRNILTRFRIYVMSRA